MIHDIDIILNLLDTPIRQISASDISVLSDTIDIANVTASRTSQKPQRKLRIFQKDAYLSADFQNRTLSINRKSKTDHTAGFESVCI